MNGPDQAKKKHQIQLNLSKTAVTGEFFVLYKKDSEYISNDEMPLESESLKCFILTGN